MKGKEKKEIKQNEKQEPNMFFESVETFMQRRYLI